MRLYSVLDFVWLSREAHGPPYGPCFNTYHHDAVVGKINGELCLIQNMRNDCEFLSLALNDYKTLPVFHTPECRA